MIDLGTAEESVQDSQQFWLQYVFDNMQLFCLGAHDICENIGKVLDNTSKIKICGSERDRNQWSSRYCGGSAAGLDTPLGSQHPAPHSEP